MQLPIFMRFFILFGCESVVKFFQTRPEVNNPTTSLMNMRESLFLIANGVNIYDNGTLQPAPWFLTLISFFTGILDNHYMARLLFVGMDLLIAGSLYKLTEFIPKSPLRPDQVVKGYFYNPLSLCAIIGMSMGMMGNLVQLMMLNCLLGGRGMMTAILSGFLIHMDIYNLAVIGPIVVISMKTGIKSLAVWLILSISSMWLCSNYWKIPVNGLAGLADILDSVYFSRMRTDSLRPNSGMSWYLFSQVFPVFTPMLKWTFQLILAVFIPACSIKFRKNPVFMFLTLIGAQMILKGYPSVSDYSLFFSVLLTQMRIVERTRILLIALFVAFGVFVMMLQIWRYWIELPGLNVNFYYIFTLIWNATLITILIDVVSAYNLTELYEENPGLSGRELEGCKVFQR